MKLLKFVEKVLVEDRGMPKLFPWQKKMLSKLEKADIKKKCIILGRRPQVSWLQRFIDEAYVINLPEQKENQNEQR